MYCDNVVYQDIMQKEKNLYIKLKMSFLCIKIKDFPGMAEPKMTSNENVFSRLQSILYFQSDIFILSTVHESFFLCILWVPGGLVTVA